MNQIQTKACECLPKEGRISCAKVLEDHRLKEEKKREFKTKTKKR